MNNKSSITKRSRTHYLVAFFLLLSACTRTQHISTLTPVPVPHDVDIYPDSEDNDATPNDALHYYLMKRLPEGASELSPDWFAQAQRHTALMPRLRLGAKAAAGMPWTQLGPGNIGGRTRSLLINPQSPNIMYAGAVTGGVWKSTDSGQNWNLLTDPSANITVGAMVMDPTNPNIIYAGTGESYQDYPGLGIYKSTDGATFSLLSATANTNFTYVNRLAIGNGSPLHIYAATTTGLWASLDGGATWQRQLLASACDDLQSRTDLATDYLFATCASGSSTAVFRNTDAAGSGSWAKVFSNPAMARTSLAIAPSQQSTVYALASSNGKDNPLYVNGLQAVYRSTSNGDSGSWVTMTDNTNPNLLDTSVLSAPICAPSQSLYSIGWYANLIAVDPTNPNRLWAGSEAIYRSEDGGANWTFAALTGAHVDNHVFTFHPNYNGASNQTLYLGNDGGLFRSDDALVPLLGTANTCNGTYPMTWQSLNNSYVATQFYGGTPLPGGAAYFGGTQDNGVIRGNDASGLNAWTTISGGDGGVTAIDPADASTLYMGIDSLVPLGFFKSTDGGVTARSAINGIPSTESSLFVSPFAVDPNDGAKLWLGAASALYRTVDGAASWTVAAPQPSVAYAVSAVAVSPFDSNSVIFGTTAGHIYYSHSALSTSGSAPWASSQPRATFVSWIAFDPNNRDIVYATYSAYRNGNPNVSHVYKSMDGGVTWNGIDGTGSTALADIPINTMVVDPQDQYTLYVGSDTGIYVTHDGGNTWAHDESALADAWVNTLSLDRTYGASALFAFTFGRGVWKTPLAGAVTGCSYSASPTELSAPAVGGLFPVAVTTGSTCPWVVVPTGVSSFASGQAPASGTGSADAVVSVAPNFTSGVRITTVAVAGTTVNVSQLAAVLSLTGRSGYDEYSGLTPATLPYTGAANDTRGLTANSSDPVHSCSGSADYKTAWWVFAAPSTGMMEITSQSERRDSPGGNAGFVLTAYPSGSVSAASELGCTTVPRDTDAWVYSKIRFAVTAGTNYVVEVSATGNTANDGGATLLYAAMGSPDFTLSLAPSAAQIVSGNSLQFSANSTATLNPTVRWSLSPALGMISPSGLYTAPPGISAPTTVTVTATAFADSNRQASVKVTVTPSLTLPAIAAVVNGASFLTGSSPGSWMTIEGANLSSGTRVWTAADFAGPNLPTELDGTKVTVNGKPAYIYYVSPTQLNVLTPADNTQGPVQVQVTAAGQTGTTMTATESTFSPALFMFAPQGQRYAAAVRIDGQYIGPANLYPGVTAPTKAGDTLQLYATGLGPTLPAVPPGQIFSGAPPTANTVTCTIGGVKTTVQFAGLVGPGEYQINIVVPPGLPSGDNLVVLSVEGFATQAGAYLTVQ